MKKLILFTLATILTTTLSAQVIYVDHRAVGARDGSNWKDAFNNVQDAFDAASPGSNIWICRGKYTLESKDASFVIDKPLKIYGGFKGDETSASQRNYKKYITDLSGDVLEDDDYEGEEDNKVDNARHVIIIEEGIPGVIIDGVTIRGGDADLTSVEGIDENEINGAGILNLGSSLMLKNSVLIENFADSLGGGIFVDPTPGVSIEIHNCRFENCSGMQEGGAIMVETDNANLIVSESKFESNIALRGGAIRFRGEGASIDVKSSEFRDNIALWGSGISINKALKCDITNCEIDNNWALNGGGGIYMFNIMEALIDNCNIVNNSAFNFEEGSQSFGGGIYVADFPDILYGTNVIIQNSELNNNFSSYIGGGLAVELGKVEIYDSEIDGNSATVAGGGMIVFEEADLRLEGVEVRNNEADFGAGIYLQDNGDYIIDNCEINSNLAESEGGGMYVHIDSVGSLPITNSIINENSSETSGGGIYLRSGTMTVSNVEFVENNATWGGGISNNNNSSATIIGSRFYKNEANLTGGGLEGYGPASYHIQKSAFEENTAESGGALGTEIFESITIEDSDFKNNKASYAGGGISIVGGGSLSIIGSDFTRNKAVYSGAIDLNDIGTYSDIMMSNFEENKSTGEAGAVGCYFGAELQLSNSNFIKNISQGNGGALVILTDSIASNPHIVDACLFDDNRAYNNVGDGFGSAAILYNSSTNFQNCQFSNNYSAAGGTIQVNDYDDQENVVSLLNCTFANNNNRRLGTLVVWDNLGGDQVNLSLQNNIFADDDNVVVNYQGEAGIISNGGNLSVNNSMEEVFTHEKDQLETDPLFVNDENDFQLSGASPAIDAGVNDNAPAFDILGNPRDQTIDIGAYESTDTGFKPIDKVPAGTVTLLTNPIYQEVNFNLESDWEGSYTAAIVNYTGQVLWDGTFQKNDTNSNEIIFVNNLPAGIYFLNINKSEKVSTKAFIKK